MLDKLKAKIFPCTEKMNRAIEDNCRATQRVINACVYQKPMFPPLKDGQIVNPR